MVATGAVSTAVGAGSEEAAAGAVLTSSVSAGSVPSEAQAAHTHGAELLVTVLSGEQTVRDAQGGEKVYKAGESFTEYPGEYLEIGNVGQDLVTVSALALLPKGATLSTTKEGISTDNAPPGPTTLYKNSLAGNSK